MCLNTYFFFYLFLKTALIFVSHKQVPFWLQHPKAVTTGIHRWHLSVGVTQLQVVVGHHHVNKPVRGRGEAKQVRHENQNSQAEMKSFLKHVATATGCKSAPRLNSLSDGADSKLSSDAAIGSRSPRHGVIFQLFPPFIKVSLCGSVFIQEAIVLVLLERKGHSSLAANHTAS